jgi:glycopeptide antibiotics resistance protein
MEAEPLTTSADDLRTARRRALYKVMFAALLEVFLVMPFVNQLALNPTVHFTQHGFIFAGGVLMGLALRDVQRTARR